MKKDASKKKPREKSKTRVWEKERRDRLSECFNKLKETLPSYDASKSLSKIDILLDATSTIKDLDEKLKKILVSSDNERNEEQKFKVSAEIIKKLQDRVKKLLVRNEELANLLKNAGIHVPSVCGAVKKFRRSYKLSNKLTPGQVKVLQKELEKENQIIKPPKAPKPKKTKRNAELKFKKGPSNPKSNKCHRQKVTNLISSPNCLFIVSQPRLINNSCYIFSKNPKKTNPTVLSNSLLIKTPIVSSDIKPSIFSTNPPLSGLVPGTLLFTNGTVMPVIPTPPPLPVLPTIFTNPVQSNLPTLIVVSCNSKTFCTNKISVSTGTKSTGKNLDTISLESKSSGKDSMSSLPSRPVLKPKSCITKTTQINKVPIPALSSQYNKHLCLESLKSQPDEQRNKLNSAGNNIQKTKGTVSNKKSNGKRTQEESRKEQKKSKTAMEESKRDVMNAGPATCEIAKLRAQSTNGKVEVSHPSESSKALCQVTKVRNAENQQKNNDGQNHDDKFKPTAICNSEKEIPSSGGKLIETHLATVKELETEISTSNIVPQPSSQALDNATVPTKSCKQMSETIEIADNHITSNECNTPSIPKNIKNNMHSIEEKVQTKIVHKTKSCEAATTVEQNTSNDMPIEAPANKQETKTFAISTSQSESITRNSNTNDLKSLEINLPPSELSNDIFASFQVPPGCQNAGSTSPTAAFLLAFPLVSSGIKVTEVIGDENSESHAGTPNLLQIGTMDISKPTQSYSESLTPSLLNFENFSFFSNKDNCGGFYNSCNVVSTTSTYLTGGVNTVSNSKTAISFNSTPSIASQGVINTDNKDSKFNTTENLKFPSNKKPDTVHIKSSGNSNYKMDIAGKVPAISKNSNVNIHQDSLQSSKDLKAQLYNSYTFDRGSDLGNMTTNMLDMNTNPFSSSKLVANESYAEKMKPNMSGQVFVSKPTDSCTSYPNYRDCTSFVTTSVVANKNYNSVYTSAGGNNNCFYNSSGGDNRHFNTPNCNSYLEYRKPDNFPHNYNGSSHIYQKEKNNQSLQPKMKPSSTQNKTINWMTSPSTTVSYKPEYFLPPFTKEPSFNPNLSTTTSFNMLPSNTYFNSSTVYNPAEHLNTSSDLRKTVDLSLPTYTSYQRTENEENQFSWSPNKMPQFLDLAHSHTFVSSTLPTLVGDLALNNTPILDQKNVKDKNKDNRRKLGHCENQGQTNFLSVSQLVEHTQEQVPAKVMSRRGSGNRSKSNTPKAKRVATRSDVNKDMPSYQKNDKVNPQKHFNISVASNLFGETKQQPRSNKNIPSSYSAEALIGNQLTSTDKRHSGHNKAIIPNFLGENVVSYFPSVDASQDNGYIQTNQSFQTNSFTQNFTTTFQNNSYGANNFISSACPITSSYIPNNTFMHNSTQDFVGEHPNIFQSGNNNVQTKDKSSYVKNCYRQLDKDDKNESYNCKKAKKRNINESALPSFDIPFLSMPGNINSPILPDDFHTTYLPPTTLYSCKNPLYSKPNTDLSSSTFIPSLPTIPGSKAGNQHSEMSLGVNSAGTSLTNFNLSTIFPEITKGPLQDTFSDSRIKDYHPVSKSYSMPSSLQVPFNSKSSIPFGSFGT